MIWFVKWLLKLIVEYSFRVDVIKDDELGVRMLFLFILVLRVVNDFVVVIIYKLKINI